MLSMLQRTYDKINIHRKRQSLEEIPIESAIQMKIFITFQ